MISHIYIYIYLILIISTQNYFQSKSVVKHMSFVYGHVCPFVHLFVRPSDLSLSLIKTMARCMFMISLIYLIPTIPLFHSIISKVKHVICISI